MIEMASGTKTYTVRIHPDPDGLWAEVLELPGVFATGDTMEELWESLEEGVSLYLSEPGRTVTVKLLNERPDAVDEPRQFDVCYA